MTDTARDPSWSDLAPGLSVEIPFSIGSDEMDKFRELSGDANPLHTDDSFAISKGFTGRVVYGGLIVAQISRLLGMELPGRQCIWAGLKISFLKPLLLNQPAILKAEIDHLSDATRYIQFSFTVTSANEQIAKGTAETVMHSDD